MDKESFILKVVREERIRYNDGNVELQHLEDNVFAIKRLNDSWRIVNELEAKKLLVS